MVGKTLGKIAVAAAVAMLISACGASRLGPQDKIAVVNWEKAVGGHPQYGKLKQGEGVLKDLLGKRQGQEKLAQAQLGSLNKLRNLRQLSEQSYLTADFNTRMVEQREIENKKLQSFIAAAEKEAAEQLAPRKKEIEDSYQLKIFNLRALLESIRLKPDERKALQQELEQAQHERGSRVMELELEKQALVDAKVKPYAAQMQARMAEAAAAYRSKMQAQLSDKDDRDKELMSAAPKALQNALAIMDREIAKQQDKNDRLKQQINKDIESQAVRLAHERGYTIVFNQYKVNLKAEDITDLVISNLNKQ
ncbi:MAG: hypothetical protein Q4E64_07885 [Phascolarctobacterium sp.]|uniref:hypothetical protein n=1 Tax=Phascolarctobacterium sp. TaxID=2049039 RepID=UPI0026DBE192|nr:hypothetical protein [Phascolarctobacterium sp.]MDO4921730.1 hypothetical protein [Phascolarctobacterium sp.]